MSIYEKTPKDERLRAKTKGEELGDVVRVRVYSWPNLLDAGIDKIEQMQENGYTIVETRKAGRDVIMEKPAAKIAAERRERYIEMRGRAPGVKPKSKTKEVYKQHGEHGQKMTGEQEETIVTGREVLAAAGVKVDQ